MSDSHLKNLGKIVSLAKRGIGGEKDAALRIVRSICAKHNLDFDRVMDDIETHEYALKYKPGEEMLAIQVVCRYGKMKIEDQLQGNSMRRMIFFQSTQDRFVEVQNAYSLLSNAYRKEKKKIQDALFVAFLRKHDLYYHATDAEREAQKDKADNDFDSKTQEEKEEMLRQHLMAQKIQGDLDDVDILKTLSSGNK